MCKDFVRKRSVSLDIECASKKIFCHHHPFIILEFRYRDLTRNSVEGNPETSDQEFWGKGFMYDTALVGNLRFTDEISEHLFSGFGRRSA